jgi:phenylacetic acid degradation operon negative regulatory protein
MAPVDRARRPASRSRTGAAATADRLPSARSILQSVLLGSDPPALSTRSLVRTAQLFQISAGTTRVAIARMVAAGELAFRGDHYHVAGPLLARRDEVLAARHPSQPESWDGSWTVVVVPGEEGRPRELRQATQVAMRRSHLARLRDGVWVRPGAVNPFPVEELQAVTFATASAAGLSAQQVERLWRLPEWAQAAHAHVAVLRYSQGSPNNSDELAELFIAGTRALDHLTKDPRLPSELLPPDWPAAVLRAEWQTCDERIRVAFGDWLQS